MKQIIKMYTPIADVFVNVFLLYPSWFKQNGK